MPQLANQDDFSQYERKPAPQAAPEDEFSQYERNPASAAATVATSPTSRFQTLVGNVKRGVAPMLKDAYQISAPGVAMSILEKRAPSVSKAIGDAVPALRTNAAPAGELPGKLISTAAPLMVGEPPEDTIPRSPRAISAVEGDAAGPGRAARIAKIAVEHVPGYKLGRDILEAWHGPEPPKLPTPKAPPTLLGKGTYGTPIDLWGKPAPPVYPGAPLPSVPAPEQLNPSTPAEPIPPRTGLQLSGQIATPNPEVIQPRPINTEIPRTLSGESALNQALTALDNKTLLKVARSRGIDIAKEAQLKPGIADQKIVRKIVDDFSPDELDEVRNQWLEVNRHGPAPAAGKEDWHVKVLKTYFPDVNIPQATLSRVDKAKAARTVEIDPKTGRPEFSDVLRKNPAATRTVKIDPATGRPEFSDVTAKAQPDEDLTDALKKSVEEAKKKRAPRQP